jgi:hypothetical protein
MSFADIAVIKVDPNTRRVSFKLQNKKLSGIDKLVQIVVLSLLESSGQDVLDPDRGGGLNTLVGSNFDPSDPTEILGEVAHRVRKSEKEIIESQLGLDESPESKLSEIQIMGLEQSENIDEVFVRIRIINEVGQISDLAV